MRAWWLLLAGCAPQPCEEIAPKVALESAAGMDEADVLAAFERFRAWTSAPVCVAQVRITAALHRGGHELLGSMKGGGRPVMRLSSQSFERVVWHELCHHIDRDFSEVRPELLTRDLFEGYAPPELWDAFPTERIRRRELFAALCEHGPEALAVVDPLHDEACGSGRWQPEVAQWMHAEVFDEAGDRASPARLLRGPRVAWPSPIPLTEPRIGGAMGGGWLVLDWQWEPGDVLRLHLVKLGEEPWVTSSAGLGWSDDAEVVWGASSARSALLWLREDLGELQELVVIDPLQRVLPAPSGRSEPLWRVAGSDDGFVALDRPDGSTPTLRYLDALGRQTGDVFLERWSDRVVRGEGRLWVTAYANGTTGIEHELRTGSPLRAPQPEEVDVVDVARLLPTRRVVGSNGELQVGEEVWATHERPDGTRALVVTDAAGEHHVVVEPCGLQGELHLKDGVPWELWWEEGVLVGVALGWEGM
jgi:hypothetical protein